MSIITKYYCDHCNADISYDASKRSKVSIYGDLPKEGIEVLNDDGVKAILINGHWRYAYGDEWEDDAHLDHWCEMPRYEEDD